MSSQPPSSDQPPAVALSETEQDELNNRVLSGDADQQAAAEAAELARLGSYVLLEVDAEQHVEKHSDEQVAERRYEELKERHIDSGGSAERA